VSLLEVNRKKGIKGGKRTTSFVLKVDERGGSRTETNGISKVSDSGRKTQSFDWRQNGFVIQI